MNTFLVSRSLFQPGTWNPVSLSWQGSRGPPEPLRWSQIAWVSQSGPWPSSFETFNKLFNFEASLCSTITWWCESIGTRILYNKDSLALWAVPTAHFGPCPLDVFLGTRVHIYEHVRLQQVGRHKWDCILDNILQGFFSPSLLSIYCPSLFACVFCSSQGAQFFYSNKVFQLSALVVGRESLYANCSNVASPFQTFILFFFSLTESFRMMLNRSVGASVRDSLN